MKRALKTLLLFFSLVPILSFGQIENPVSWTSEIKSNKDGTATILFHATIDDHWHLYSPELGDGGPIPTTFVIENPESFEAVSKLESSKKAIKTYDSLFMMEILYFDHAVTFSQVVKQIGKETSIKGYVEYMTCDDTRCLPPNTYEFDMEFPLVKKEAKAPKKAEPEVTQTTAKPKVKVEPIATETPVSNTAQEDSTKETVIANPITSAQPTPTIEPATTTPTEPKDNSLIWIFFAGFLGGLVALLTPCVFPMIPMTVSVFMKMGGKGSGVKNALMYGASIIILYVSLGAIVTLIYGADGLNALATNPWFNLAFFVILVVFAAAFLGAFELQLPTSWANFFDQKVDSSTGFVSILFMAFTLALVSFSCTGPIVGSLLGEAALTGNFIAPMIGMLGFSVALALPFTVFAMFPSMLSSLPKSGGWLNSVKVVLGFLELAFAFKFLSTADLTMHWGILPREVFLAIWIIIFTLLGFYLLGKLTFAHDSKLEYISVTRLFLAITSFVFALWMVPGMWGAPLKAISAFPPPLASQDFIVGGGSGHVTKDTHNSQKKYGDLFHCPNGLDCYFDLDEAKAVAKKENKPLLIDFTGHGCVNCREMEANVLSDKGILETLAKDYVVVSLYVDDRTKLPKEEQVEIEIGGAMKKIRTIGNKWSAYQTLTYQTNSQPYYVITDTDGKQLLPARAYDLSIPDYQAFLEEGVKIFKQK